MRASALDDSHVVFLKFPEYLSQMPDSRQQPVLQGTDCGDMEGGRKGIVGGLAHIDVIVGMAEFFPGDLVGPVRNDFIGVHIALGPAAGLPDNQRKMIHEGS